MSLLAVPELLDQAAHDAYEPPPTEFIDEWAGQFRELDKKASAEPGRWRNARTPYLVEIMRKLSPQDPAQRIVFMKGSQVGGTEAGNNWIGYTIHRSPGPMLMVTPTMGLAKRAKKQRLAPMFSACTAIADKISEAKDAGQASTTFEMEFPGGMLILTGSNSAAGLKSMPIRYLFCDEVDEYPGDVEEQGDAVGLAEVRTNTYATSKKVYLVSTPTMKGASKIEKEFESSDKRRYFVPCPHCRNMDWIRWSNIRYTEDDPGSAKLMCEACGVLIEERHKTWMMDPANGAEWRATAKGNGTIGYHLSGLYSPIGWKSWAECVSEWIAAQRDPMLLKKFVNTVLGETYEDRRDKTVDADALLARCKPYAAEVPRNVGALTMAVDVQDDRLECKVKGWAAGEESYLIAYHVIPGDPGLETVWRELDTFRATSFQHELGSKVRVDVTVIDSGGHFTDEVYRYCASRERCFAIRGGGEQGFVMPPTRGNAYRIPLFTLNVTAGKDTIFSRLLIDKDGPGCMHFPEWLTKEYFDGLTAEKSIHKWVRGKGSRKEYVKIRDRNEPLDLEVYSLAALYMLGVQFIKSLPERARGFTPAPAAPPPSPSSMPGLPQFPGPGGGWVNRW